jgi:hypothetical protein
MNSRFSAALLIALSMLVLQTQADEPTSVESTAGTSTSSEFNIRDRLEAHCIDGSVLKVRLLDAKVPLKTDYGIFDISSSDIRRIEFANRVPESLSRQLKAAVAKLGDDDYHVREAATAQLLSMQQLAYPALMAAAQSEDLEVVHRAEQLVNLIRQSASQDDLELQEFDVIYTDKSQIAGTIQLASLKVESVPLGEQQLKLEMLRRLQLAGEGEVNALPDPGNLFAYQNQIGKTLYFRVTGLPQGSQNGFVWGTDMYTLDSSLALAAAHAGLVRPGQTKLVGVTILGPQNSFSGSARNGVGSADFGPYPGAFRFKSGRPPTFTNRAAATPAPPQPMQVAPQFNFGR